MTPTPLHELTACLQAALDLAKVVSPTAAEMIGQKAQEALDKLKDDPPDSPPPPQ